MKGKKEGAEITILYDDKVLEEGLDLYPDWGISIHLKKGSKDILFDVGHDKNILKHNLDELGLSIEDIDIIVISHRHWDHFGGLSAFEDQEINIYVPEALKERIKKEFDLSGEIVSVSESTKIIEGIHSTGELGRAIKEQSLLVEGKDGIYILTGCGHPGIGNIIENASDLGPVKGIIGGYHGFKELELLSGISLLVPCHCTMLLDKIKENYPEAYRRCGVGFNLDI